jgi:hypothetical protein
MSSSNDALQRTEAQIMRGDRLTLFFNSWAKTTEPWNDRRLEAGYGCRAVYRKVAVGLVVDL